MDQNLIGIKAMAEKLDVPQSWIYSRTRTNEIPHYKVGKGDKSKYAISERWRKYGTPDFLEASRPKDMRSGRGFRSGNEHWKKRIIGVKNDNPPIAKNDNPSNF